MPRNLVRRIELLTAVKDEEARNKIVQILKLQCSDNVLAHELQSDGTYIKVKAGERSINNHKLLEEYVNRISKATRKETSSHIKQLVERLFIES
jgi:polyphosphate kinase